MVKNPGEKSWSNFSRRWDLYLVFLFLLTRLILNISLEPLFMFFFVVYLIFITMLYYKARFFSTLLVIFLYIDSIIGTYLFTSANNLGAEFYGTMAINLIFIFIIMRNFNGNFTD